MPATTMYSNDDENGFRPPIQKPLRIYYKDKFDIQRILMDRSYIYEVYTVEF
jgi:hypothetical protein